MAVGRKINATGRTAGPYSGRDGRLYRPPLGVDWVFLDIKLLGSPAFQALSINARKVFDFLLIEHRQHGQTENGRLMAPYDQLERFGVSRRLIRSSFAELHAAGLVRLTRQGGMVSGDRVAAQYRLTIFTDIEKSPPSNEWKSATAQSVISARKDTADDRDRRRVWRSAGAKRATGSQS